MRRVLVIGASGALGARICDVLAHDGVEPVPGTRSRPRGSEVHVDATDEATIAAALEGVDVVVVAAPQHRPLVQRVCARERVPCVDVAPHGRLRELARRELAASPVPLVMMGGFFPGMSGVLAGEAAAELDEVDEIRIGLLQSANARVGATGVQDMLRQVAGPVPTLAGSETGFRRRHRMPVPGARATVRLMRCDERDVLLERFPGSEVAYFTAWSSASLTAAVAGLRALGLLDLLLRTRVGITPRHDPSRPQTVHLSAEAIGTVAGERTRRSPGVTAASDYGATALMVSVLVRHLLADGGRVGGVLVPAELLTLRDLGALVDHHELASEGRPDPSAPRHATVRFDGADGGGGHERPDGP